MCGNNPFWVRALHQLAWTSIHGSIRALFEDVRDVDAATGERTEREKWSEWMRWKGQVGFYEWPAPPFSLAWHPTPLPQHLRQVPSSSHLLSMSTSSTPPSPQPCAPRAVEGGDEGVLPCCAPPQPPVALLWTLLCPPPLLPPTLHSPAQPLALQPPSHPIAPPPPSLCPGLPCWAGDRPLNAGPGVPDGSYRWSVVIGPTEACHRLFPAKIQRLGFITCKKKKKKKRQRVREEESKRESASQRMTKATMSFAIKGESVTECFLCSY